METKYIIIGLLIILVVLFLMQKKEHAGSTQALSNEAVQNIAKVYADTNGTATFNNIKNTGDATFNGIKNTGTLTTNGEASFASVTNLKGGGKGDIQTHLPFWDGKNYIRGPTQIDGDTTINGNFNINNKKFRMFWMNLGGGSGYKVVKDPKGNTYNAKDWILFSGGPVHANFVHYALIVNKADNLWYIDKQGNPGQWLATSILCMPVEMFDNDFTYPYKANSVSDTSAADGTHTMNFN
jgi:hypothetical protein